MTQTRSEVLEWLGADPTFARVVAGAGKLDRLEQDDAPLVRFALLRNITVEPGLPAALKIEAARAGLRSVVYLGDFDNVQQDVFDERSALYAGAPDVIVLALRLQTLSPRLVLDYTALDEQGVNELVETTLERVTSFVSAIRLRSPAIVVVHNFEQPVAPAYGILDFASPTGQQNTIRRLNVELAARLAAIRSTYIVDVDHILAAIGYDRALDDRYWHIGRAPYRFEVLQRFAREYAKFAVALKGKSKKCLVLDCDNTLWGGVIGEDGLNGIKLGATHPGSAYVEFHAAVLDLYRRGVLIALNSKNNAPDALEVFESHPDSLLRPHHIVAKRINWQDKATNLRELAAELNIGLDSLVFVDDSPFECQYVRESCPEVAVVELPADASSYARILRGLPYFETLTLSAEDRRRSELYVAEARRSELEKSSTSMDQYLESLGMVLTISPATPFSVARISQLTQKTNQFNVTTRRYSENEILRFVDDPAWRVYYAHLEDKFADAGIIAVALVEDRAADSRIDTFLMSCRVIGRGVEDALMAVIAADSRARGKTVLIGEYVKTPKNDLVRDFHERLGFTEEPGTSGQWWRMPLDETALEPPQWFRRIVVNGEAVSA